MKKILFILFLFPIISSGQKTHIGVFQFDSLYTNAPYNSGAGIVHLGIDTVASSPTFGKLVRKTASASGISGTITGTRIAHGDGSGGLTTTSGFDITSGIMRADFIKSENVIFKSELVPDGNSKFFQIASQISGDQDSTTGVVFQSLNSGLSPQKTNFYIDRFGNTIFGLSDNLTGVANYFSNRSSSYTARSLVDKNYVDSSLATVSGGTPTLTATYVGYGDGSNLLTGTSNFVYDNSNKKLILIDGSADSYIEVGNAGGTFKTTISGAGFTSISTGFISVLEQSTPATPSGRGIFYFKSDNLPYALNDAGTEMALYNVGGASTFAALTDVNLTSLATNDFLKWDGTDWINRTPANVRSDLSLVVGTNVQAWDTDLDGLAGLSANGIVARTGSGTYSPRTITGTTNQIVVTNGDGVSGNPTLSLPATLALTGSATASNEIRIAEDTDNGTDYVAITVPSALASSRLATFPDASTFIPIISQVLTFSGPTAARTYTLPDANGTIQIIDAVQTVTNKRITKRTGTVASSATPTINTDNVDLFTITAQTVDITSMTTNLSGTPNDGDEIEIWITGTASRAITWGASFAASAIALPTTTSGTSTLRTKFIRSGSTWVIKGQY